MKNNPSKRCIAYISSLGMLEPLGESQVIQYLKYLAQDYEISLISFEKAKDWSNDEFRERMISLTNEFKIDWRPRPYSHGLGPLSGLINIYRGLKEIRKISTSKQIKLIHARSYYPAVIAFICKLLKKIPFVFDMRGFWVDEKVDSGRWKKNSLNYRIWKWIEKQLILNASEIVSLSQAGINEMKRFNYIDSNIHSRFRMIPTCADLTTFQPDPNWKKEAKWTVGYVGSTQNWYDFDITVAFMKKLMTYKPDSHFLIINKGEHDFIRSKLREYDFPQDNVTLKSVAFSEMSNELKKMTLSVFFIKKLYSKIASNPTKLGELLGCAIPCVTGSDIGDVTEIVRDNKVGVIIESMDSDSLDHAMDHLFNLVNDPETRTRCRETAEEIYSVAKGVENYAKIYSKYY